MPTSTTVKGLNINELTEAQYDAAVQGGVIGPNELSVLTDVSYVEPSDLATVATTGDYDDLINKPTIPAALPDQTGHSGEFLTTDGTDASWSNKPLVNKATGTDGIGIGGASLVASGQSSIAVGPNPQATATGAIAIGVDARATVTDGIAIGDYARSSANKAYQIGSGTNSTANSFKVGSHQLLNLSDGTIPTARFTTDPVSDGTYVPTLTISSGVATRSWSAPSGGLPSQTGNAGKFLTTDGTDASWAAVSAYTAGTGIDITSGVISVKPEVVKNNNTTYPLYNIAIADGATASSNGVAVGYNAQTTGGASVGQFCSSTNGFAGGTNCKSTATGGVALGKFCGVTATNAIQIGSFTQLTNNSDANTFKVGNANGNFEIMSADGTIPEARLADTTNAAQGQVLTLDNSGNAVWQTPSTAVTSTTATLTVAGWSSNTQTLTVSGVTSSNVVIVSPQPLSSGDYATAGVLCTAQNTNSLTFTCTQTPSNAIDLSIVIIG